MRTVDLQILEAEFDEYFRLVLDGETILITEEDRPLAELGPPQLRPAADPQSD
jgi:antitoxin (DNA-binding transcriptional repressor) of toxin-antitoxin stability system